MNTDTGKQAMLVPKVLLITKQDFSNPRDGGAMRTNAVYEHLLSRGLDVTALFAEPQPADSVASSPRLNRRNFLLQAKVLLSYLRIGSISSIRWFSPRLVDEIAHTLKSSKIDCVVIEYTQLMGYSGLFDQPLILDMHNIESELLLNYSRSSRSFLRRLVAAYESRRLNRLEKRACSTVDLISTVSARDSEIAKSWTSLNSQPTAKIVVAPNGVSALGFEAEEQTRNDVVFVAHLGWQPNIDAAKWLVREVWPIVRIEEPELQLRLIGRAPAADVLELAGLAVSIHADVESVVEFVAAAKVATAPLQAAGGTRLKILEALSCGTPVVSTSLGALGLESLEGACLSIVDEPADFAAEIVRMSRMEPDRSASRAEVETFRWPNTLRQLGDEVQRIAGAWDTASRVEADTKTISG